MEARRTESERVANWAFRQFSLREVAEAGSRIAEAEVWMGATPRVGLVAPEDLSILIPATGDVEARIAYQGPIAAPIEAGQEIAELVLDREGMPEMRIPLVAETAVPRLADWCFVDLVEADGAIRRVAAAHVDPESKGIAAALRRRHMPHAEGFAAVARVVKSGDSERSTETIDQMIAATPDPGFKATLRGLGQKATMIVPLRARGRTLGALTFIAAESGRRYDEADLATAQDLADRAAIAIENAQLYRELRDADRRKDEFLATLAHELRNPLAPVRNGLQILQLGGTDSEEARETLSMMDRQLGHITHLVDDLMDVARVSSGKVTLRRDRVGLRAIVDAVAGGRTTVPGLRAGLPGDTRWTLEGIDGVEDLWRAEAGWWQRVEHDGFELLRGSSFDQRPVVGALAWAARGGGRGRRSGPGRSRVTGRLLRTVPRSGFRL